MTGIRHRVAVVIGNLGQGGSERQLYLFLAHRDRSRWDPVVYVSGELGFWEQPIRDLGVPVVLLRGNPLAKLRQFRAATIAQGARYFFSWSSYTNGYAVAFPGPADRCTGSFRNADFADLPRRLRRCWRWLSLKAISQGICNSRDTQAAVIRTARRGFQALFVPNAVETIPHEQARAWREHWRGCLGVDDGTILVVGAGRLAPQKCYHRFIEAIALTGGRRQVCAVIAGADHGCRAAVEAQVAALGLQDRVRLIGAVPDAREVIAAGDVFLLSSDHEGMPNVVLEAMAAGVPCVSTRVNGVTELIRQGDTGFVAGRDAGELARHVDALAADTDLQRRIGENARAFVEHEYRPEQIVPRLWAACEHRVMAE